MCALRLEVFGHDAQAGQTVVTDTEAIEEARLSAYEEGYGAGWEDAFAAQGTDAARVAADLSHNLQALGFTFHEARIHVLRALEPLLRDIAARLLPRIAQESLAPLVVEMVMPLAEAAAGSPIKVIFNPSARAAIEAATNGRASLPLTLVEEPTLGEGQVYLRLGESETQVDLDAAVAGIAAAMQDFFDSTRQERAHG